MFLNNFLRILSVIFIAIGTECALLRVSVAFEPLCSHSSIIGKQIYPTLKEFGGVLNPYLAVDLIPYGKCNTTFECGSINFTCRRGDRDVEAYKVHACALRAYSKEDYFAFISCTVLERNNSNANFDCAQSHGLDFMNVEHCAKSWEGNVLFAANGIRKGSMQIRPKQYPWILFENEYEENDADDATTNFMGLVCKKLEAKNISPRQCVERKKCDS